MTELIVVTVGLIREEIVYVNKIRNRTRKRRVYHTLYV